LPASLETHSEGVRFAVRLTPRGGRDAVKGWQKDSSGRDYLKARVRAPADKGEANAALVGLLAKWLDVPRASVAIMSGKKARLKLLSVQGDPDYLISRMRGMGRKN
jgi:uncharacterized protein (TIGR00251 family)